MSDAPLSPVGDPALEAAVQAGSRLLLERMNRRRKAGLLTRKGLYHRLMHWSMRDPEFKADLFRFVDLLPVLGTGEQVVGHLREYLREPLLRSHPWLNGAFRMAAWTPGLTAAAVRSQVSAMALQFVAGENTRDLVRRFRANAREGIATTVDLLGEAVVSEKEAERFLDRNLSTLSRLAEEIARDPAPAFSDVGLEGVLPRLNLSIKISALAPAVDPRDPARSIAAIKERLRPILRRASETGAFVNFDMESYRLKDLTLALFKSVFEEHEFRQTPGAGVALQAYLRDTERDLLDLIGWARDRRRPVGVRLVKGAYWDYEVIVARQQNWPLPVWERKAETDASFERLSLTMLENRDAIIPAFGSHNVRSVAHAMAQGDRLGIDPRAYEFQTLYGMADDLNAALIERGCRVREYCPVGELLPGMAYLVRRLLENTSNEGFIRTAALDPDGVEELLRNPVELLAGEGAPIGQAQAAFANAANTDFTKPENRERFAKALASAGREPGERWPLVIGGRKIVGRTWVPSVNPADPAQVVGYWAKATAADAEAALEAARAAQPSWMKVPVNERAAIIERVADSMETRRFELAACEVREAGKPWAEADADVSEAIDFCRFYASEMRGLALPRVTQATPGESNQQDWIPRGTGVVIAPWNFPLAILCGMTAAPLLAGNAVIIKPAEQTSVLGALFMRMLEEAGLPAGAANLLTGQGEEVGAYLVEHPKIDFIAFTGSRAVGTGIWESAGRTGPEQLNLKKVVCEMGGKNALIIDESADLDEAIPAALQSGFGYAGQKCSALSRLIVLDRVYEKFVPRFLAACATVPVGDPAEPGVVVGPVIDEEARAKILAYIELGKKEATLAFQGTVPAKGSFVPPTVFTGVRPDAVIAREEIFGPVIAILRANGLDEAFAIANGTPYALTGGLFSRTPSSLERARREFRVGNLYLNRGITGAVVERHPFGGFGMSGAGTKAGGRGYLENFMFPRVVSENIVRRGFAPQSAGE